MKRIQALNRVLARVETCAVGGLLIGVSAVVLLQVLMRYLVSLPNPWSEELSRFAFLWMSLLGASLAVEHRAHFRFDQITRALTPRVRRAVEVAGTAFVATFALLLVVAGIALMGLTLDQRSPALNLPVAYVYAAAPVSGAFMVVHLLAASAGRRRAEAPDQEAA